MSLYSDHISRKAIGWLAYCSGIVLLAVLTIVGMIALDDMFARNMRPRDGFTVRSDPPFDATHVFQLRGSQPGYATLELRAGEQQSYQYGYHLTNITLTVNASGVGVEHVGSNYVITFKP